nr:hypothetical protein [Acinetobacter gyllenbergii]
MMLTILVEIMMSVFIANFKASEHPIINVVARGFLIMLAILVVGLFPLIKDGKEFSIVFSLMVSFLIGFIVSFLIFLIEFFFKYGERKK